MKTPLRFTITFGLLLLAGCSSTVQPAPPLPSMGSSLAASTALPGAESAREPKDFPYGIEVRTYRGEDNDFLYDILLLPDGGTLLAGQGHNTGFASRITPGKAHLIRTDPEGEIVWEKDYGGENDGMFYSLAQVGEDEYLALGQIAASYARDETDLYLVKINGEGHAIWSRTYGGRGMDHARMVRLATDGGFLLTGSQADELPTGNQYEADMILIKTDPAGEELWTQTYGDTILDHAWGVVELTDGGYILAGWEARTYQDRDVLAIRTSPNGEMEWSRSWDLDPGDRDEGNDLILTADGHIVIACIQSMDTGRRQAALVKIDLSGNEIWTRQYGEEGAGSEFWDIMEDSDEGYIMAGDLLRDSPASSGEAPRDAWVVKTDADGDVLWQYFFSAEEYDQSSFSSATVLPGSGYIFTGRVNRTGAADADMLWLKMTLP
jgi:hypothetical protein